MFLSDCWHICHHGEIKYFSDQIRVKLTSDKCIKTTIVAVFQRRWIGIFWKSIKEITFDVCDYSKLPNSPDMNSKPVNEYSLSPFQPVTVTYGEKAAVSFRKPSVLI